jgi:hypothetical protein
MGTPGCLGWNYSAGTNPGTILKSGTITTKPNAKGKCPPQERATAISADDSGQIYAFCFATLIAR